MNNNILKLKFHISTKNRDRVSEKTFKFLKNINAIDLFWSKSRLFLTFNKNSI